MKSVMNVIVTTYTIAICWVRKRDKNGGREITGAAEAWKVEQIVEFYIWKKKRRSERIKWLRLVSCLPHGITNKNWSHNDFSLAWMSFLPSLTFFLPHPLSPKQWDQDASRNFNLDLDAGYPISRFSSSAERRKEKSEGLFVMTAGTTPGLE